LDRCIQEDTTGMPRFHKDQLLQQPVLQAVFSETLRLRSHVLFMRVTEKSDIEVEGCIIPKGKPLFFNSSLAHWDSDFWSAGRNKFLPVNEFHHSRFLRPRKDASNNQSYEFIDMSSSGAWIPFGGGPRMCAGRQFAKQEMFLTAALMIYMYDCEFPTSEKDLELSMAKYGFGVLTPASKVPVRLRRRERI
jgi:cytochrome P450